MRLRVLLCSAVAFPALMAASAAWAETAIPSTNTAYTIPADGDFSVASGVRVENTNNHGHAIINF